MVTDALSNQPRLRHNTQTPAQERSILKQDSRRPNVDVNGADVNAADTERDRRIDLSGVDVSSRDAEPIPCVLAKLGRLVERRIHSAVNEIGVGASQFIAMAYIGSCPGASRADLARGTQTSPQAAGGLINRLGAKGWITRTTPPSGGPMELRLTNSGRDMLERCDAMIADISGEVLEMFKPSHAAFFDGATRGLIGKLSLESPSRRFRSDFIDQPPPRSE
jgi:DNA-binding MarR family transcriptional regulator